jgi:hypothetical protein
LEQSDEDTKVVVSLKTSAADEMKTDDTSSVIAVDAVRPPSKSVEMISPVKTRDFTWLMQIIYYLLRNENGAIDITDLVRVGFDFWKGFVDQDQDPHETMKAVLEILKIALNHCGRRFRFIVYNSLKTEKEVKPNDSLEWQLELSLGIPEKSESSIHSLNDCLVEYFRPEDLTFEPKGGESVELKRTLFLDTVPEVLLIQLKRSRSEFFESATGLPAKKDEDRLKKKEIYVVIKKCSDKVTIPLELDLGPFMKNKSANTHYVLQSAILHGGSDTKGGHYTTYIRPSTPNNLRDVYNKNYVPDSNVGGEWTYFDDSTVTQYSYDDIKTKIDDCYLFCYLRVDTANDLMLPYDPSPPVQKERFPELQKDSDVIKEWFPRIVTYFDKDWTSTANSVNRRIQSAIYSAVKGRESMKSCVDSYMKKKKIGPLNERIKSTDFEELVKKNVQKKLEKELGKNNKKKRKAETVAGTVNSLNHILSSLLLFFSFLLRFREHQ